MISPRTDNRIFGIFFILLGWFCIIALFQAQATMPPDDNETTLLKFASYIVMINGFLSCNIFGGMALTGRVELTSDETCEAIDKAKNNFLAFTLFSPAWLTATVVLFKESQNTMWKVLWTLMMMYGFYSIINYLKLKKEAENT